jgi:hypothetical protein
MKRAKPNGSSVAKMARKIAKSYSFLGMEGK